MKSKIIAVVQARMGSTRLPNKVMMPICGTPMIGILLNRLSKSQKIGKIVVATSTNSNNQLLVNYVETLGFEVFQGDENDVLDRFYHAAEQYSPEVVVRITGDCPLVDWEVVDNVIHRFEHSNCDYATNTLPPTFPDGFDVEVFSFEALAKAFHYAKLNSEREHVTPYIRNHPELFILSNVSSHFDYSSIRLTVDQQEDFSLLEKIAENLGGDNIINSSMQDFIDIFNRLMTAGVNISNAHIKRNEGYLLSLKQDS